MIIMENWVLGMAWNGSELMNKVYIYSKRHTTNWHCSGRLKFKKRNEVNTDFEVPRVDGHYGIVQFVKNEYRYCYTNSRFSLFLFLKFLELVEIFFCATWQPFWINIVNAFWNIWNFELNFFEIGILRYITTFIH